VAERELAGRVALVTGGSRNIGRAIALALAEAGASVAVNTRRSGDAAAAVAREIEAAGGRAMTAIADVADEPSVKDMVAQVAERWGGLDIVVNNAAIRPAGQIDTMSLAEFRLVTGLILEGAFLCIREALPHLRRSTAASIVNLGGMTGHVGAAQRVHVVTGKAGLAGMTKALAMELAPAGITVNCVVPGLIDTQRATGSVSGIHQANPPLVGRLGRSEEVADLVRYLCGPTARYITGQSIHVNGGSFMP
jgi:3-oxoacyl-[acyl-carrier protein] reductase